MTDLAADVTAVSAEVEKLRAEQLRAEAVASAAQAEYERVLEKLRTDFDVDSPEAAAALLISLEGQVAAELTEVRAQLATADGSV